LFENILFRNSNITHGHTNNYQVTLTFMDNPGNSLNNTEKMKVDEHTLVLIKKDCTNKFYIQNLFETLFLVILISLMVAQIIIK